LSVRNPPCRHQTLLPRLIKKGAPASFGRSRIIATPEATFSLAHPFISFRSEMRRPRQRACLEEGLSLNLNTFMRESGMRTGAKSARSFYRWTNTYTGEVTARALITAELESTHAGRLRIVTRDLAQTIILVSRPRHFGGHQWCFICPVRNRQ
jgi:hypothetical protein